MEQPRPMDRLLCGDVGYGKTEVALRAVMKCILDGKQAAILVPTTVLAQQHYATAVSRFRDFPVKHRGAVPLPPRPGAEADSGRPARTGGVDLLIGTHKLLQKRHGVQRPGPAGDRRGTAVRRHPQGAAPKEMSRQVDVLTLSATPIPRTLNMALSGLPGHVHHGGAPR
ncbi:MAG: DEAD/DEAH box helicase [Oscillospiraceae bacterium]